MIGDRVGLSVFRNLAKQSNILATPNNAQYQQFIPNAGSGETS